jgi:hypothetical protein
MRKAIVVAAAVIALVAVPATSSYAAPGHDQATGTGTLGQFGNPKAHVNAVQTPPGLNGSFTIEYPDGTSTTGTLTCLSVSQNTAYVTGKITSAVGPRAVPNGWAAGRFLVIGVQDNGEPGTAGPDKVNFSPGFDADPGCGPNPAASPDFGIVAGNYQIFDAA